MYMYILCNLEYLNGLKTGHMGYFSCPILSVPFGVIRCTFYISDVQVFKRLFFHSFRPISTKLYGSIIHRGI